MNAGRVSNDELMRRVAEMSQKYARRGGNLRHWGQMSGVRAGCRGNLASE
jgi:hypothetical protein